MNSPVAWTLVFHIVGFVFWMGGLLVATQVLAMHAAETETEARRALNFLEKRLLNGLALPGALIAIGAGILVVVEQPAYLQQTWLHAKLALVLILIGLHVAVSLRAKAFREGQIELSRQECKIWHGLISLVFFGIVVIVMIKPFG